MKKESFCAVPWVNASLDVNGSFRPCCKYEQPGKDPAKNLGNLKNSSIQELWNAAPIRHLRQQFLKGEKPTGCRTCWTEEAAGIQSYRQEFIEFRLEDFPLEGIVADYSDAPITLDLKLSNKCNLKCRICGPIASSTFLQEELSRENGFRCSNNEKEYLADLKILKDENSKQWFKKMIPHLRHVELFGGEPLLGKENKLLIEMMVQSGHSHKISLLYNTNATIFDSEQIELWRKFKRVQICLSIDDIGSRNEYQRFPSKWDVISQNLEKYSKVNDSPIQILLFCTISILNVFYFPEYLIWKAKNHAWFKLTINFVHMPDFYCIANLSGAAKNAVEKKYESFDSKLDEKDTELLKKVISFMNSIENSEKVSNFKLKSFKSEILLRDQLRHQKFQNVFPEWSQILDF